MLPSRTARSLLLGKACGEGLMPSTMAALRELGVAICPSDGQVFRGIRSLDAVTSAETSFSGASGVGVRRTVLHQKMVKRMQECGITLLWDTPVAGLSNDGAILGGTVVKARWIIGADGIHSCMRRRIGLGANARQGVRFAQRRHYRVKGVDRLYGDSLGRKGAGLRHATQ